MASAVSDTQYCIAETPYQYNQMLMLSDQIDQTQTQQSMQQQKAEIQSLLCEYYEIFLAEYRYSAPNDANPAKALNQLLDICQAWYDEDLSPVASLSKASHFSFWSRFNTTIEQYCALQNRLQNLPQSVEHWHHDRLYPS